MTPPTAAARPNSTAEIQQAVEMIAPFVESGLAIHWLKPSSKAPIGTEWSSAPRADLDALRRSYVPGVNVGVRLGEPSKIGGSYLHIIDLDIRDPSQANAAWSRLIELWPEAESAEIPTVISGSGGASRHLYFCIDRPFRSRKIAHSGQKFIDERTGRKRWTWEIELLGTGKQAVMPPSIHPDTGLPYSWGNAIDLDVFALGLGPTVTSTQARGWGISDANSLETATATKPPLGLSLSESEALLRDLPVADWCDDRDGWLAVGMALHHEFSGSEMAFDLWCNFSKRSEKFDAKDQARVWRSFQSKPNSVRMATLSRVVAAERFQDMFDEEPANIGDLGLDAESSALVGNPGPQATKTDSADLWKRKLERSDAGAFKPTLHNLTLIVSNDPRTRGLVRKNLFTQEIVQHGSPGRFKPLRQGPRGTKQLQGTLWEVRDSINGDLWDDSKDHAIRDMLEAPVRQGGYGIKVADRDLRAAVDLSAGRNAFHPVQDYLNSLTWDQQPRLEGLFVRFLGVRDTPYTREVARLTVVAGVARVFQPGHKFDFVPILEGVQGKRKSTFIETLGLHWFGELDGNFSDRKALVEKMQGALVLEIPELSGFTRGEVQDIKAFVSAREDKVRLAYAHRAQVFQRQCIFIGSTNESEYLRDSTGGRRFWPLACNIQEIDTTGFKREVHQVWAEALAVYRSMRAKQPTGDLPLYLTGGARIEAERLQESRRVETVEDATAGEIVRWLSMPIAADFDDQGDADASPPLRDETCLRQIWSECLGNERSRYDQRAAQMLGRAMGNIAGWTNVGARNFEKYGKQRVFRREGASAH